MSMTGGCLCGQLRYELARRPLLTSVCHCTHCQKQSGSAFSIMVAVPRDAVTITGDLATYADVGASGQAVLRQFCPQCGSPIFSIAKAIPGLMFVKAGSLDHTSELAPHMHIWTKSAQPWVAIDQNAKQFPENAP